MTCCGVCQYEGRHCAKMAAAGAMDAHLEEYRRDHGIDFATFSPAELFARLQGGNETTFAVRLLLTMSQCSFAMHNSIICISCNWTLRPPALDPEAIQLLQPITLGLLTFATEATKPGYESCIRHIRIGEERWDAHHSVMEPRCQYNCHTGKQSVRIEMIGTAILIRQFNMLSSHSHMPLGFTLWAQTRCRLIHA